MARPFSEFSKEILLLLQDLGEALAEGGSARQIAYALLADRDRRKFLKQQKQYHEAVRRAMQSRLVILSEAPDGRKRVKLTEKGRRKVREFRFADLTIPIPKRWDGIYRIVIFDVPIHKSSQRLMFTQKIQELGLAYLQKSVWVFPYPCFAELEFVAEELGIRRFVNFIEARSIREDAYLKKVFRLL